MSSYRDRALFLDRDGVINEDSGYVYKIDDFKFKDGIFELIKRYQEDGYLPIIVTNQSGIGRGYYTQEDYMRVTEYMIGKFGENGIKIEAVYHCPHTPDEKCSCRKPRSGMFMAAKKALKLDMKNSIMIGDKDSDMRAAYNAKVGTRIIVSNESSANATKRIDKLEELLLGS